ncbi:MAG: NeuD/PglB/VioB family sugar acetyltransferase [Kofleriaceae bacterium]|nr:NeuD/PglB/VioB family sugar acetyltransferase [Kofleriaceae bacterium]
MSSTTADGPAPLLVVGAGGHGKVVADAALATGRWRSVVFVDDRHPGLTEVLGFPVVGPLAALPALRGAHPEAIVAIGAGAARLVVLAQLAELGFRVPVIVHPRAHVSPHARLGDGTVVMAQAAVNPGSVLGLGVIVNTGAIVDHDAALADGVHVCPGACLAGTVTAGPRAWIGVGACVRQGIVIGPDVTVGAGAVVVHDLPAGVTAIGVPARPRAV